MAARSSEGVIDYVSKNPGVIGFIGVSWIGNPEDTSQMSFLKKVRVASLESTDMPEAYVKAYQANIYIKRYPMVRDLVYILKENYKGLGTAFANFMSGEIGQMIFKRAYLVPPKKIWYQAGKVERVKEVSYIYNIKEEENEENHYHIFSSRVY